MQTKRKVFQFNTELFKVTGIQRVLLDIHEALKEEYECKIVGTIPYKKVNTYLSISNSDYLQFGNPFLFRNSIVIIHERRLLPLLWFLSKIPGINAKCVYVHHNQLHGKKKLSLFPKNIVAISDEGIDNLTNYFGVSPLSIVKIHNCVRNKKKNSLIIKKFNRNNINIIYPARINSVKQQLEIVKNFKDRLDPRIKIHFAGIGPLYEDLINICQDSTQFDVLGFRDNMDQLMNESDFVMLFSKHEGLPISLIEACQNGTPIICNAVGGNCEIVHDGKNGIIVNDWEKLLNVLNSLPNYDELTLKKMGEEGVRIFNENFTFDIFKQKYIEYLSSLQND